MHLTEVGGALRQRSETDSRLALIFPKGQVAKARRPRLSEFLGKDDLKPIFRVQKSKLRQSEKVCDSAAACVISAIGAPEGLSCIRKFRPQIGICDGPCTPPCQSNMPTPQALPVKHAKLVIGTAPQAGGGAGR